MQDRYAGDVGDFIKLGLLRALSGGDELGGVLRVGVNWYLAPDESQNADGKHVSYVRPDHGSHASLRACDPDLMGRLASLVRGDRSVEALERAGALPDGSVTYRQRLRPGISEQQRRTWHTNALAALAEADLVFADPDNGIRAWADRSRAHKYALLNELGDHARRGHSLVIYHHADRSANVPAQAARRLAEVRDATGLEAVGTVIARRGTCRLFLIAATSEHVTRLAHRAGRFADAWSPHVDLILPGEVAVDPAAMDHSATAPRAARRPALTDHRAPLSAGCGLDYVAAERFIAAIPNGRWASYKDVAIAAGNPAAAQPIGNWLRNSGTIPNYWRVLRSDGFVADGFVSHAPGRPGDSTSARELLKQEGVRFDRPGRAAAHQRFTVADWQRT